MHLIALNAVAPHAAVAPAMVSVRACAPPLMAARDPEVQRRIDEMQARNQRRGAVALGCVFAVVVWLFTVPPDIRRTNICGLEEKDPFSDCTPLAALVSRVGDHYATCGRTPQAPACVALDLSIDPRSRAAFDRTVEALLSDAPASGAE